MEIENSWHGSTYSINHFYILKLSESYSRPPMQKMFCTTVIEKLIDKVGFLRKLDRRGLVNYIITAAKNTAYNYCRDKKKELDFDFEQEVIVDNYDSLEDDIIKRENLFCLDQVWNSLDSKTQYLLSAKYLLNKSGKEIANDLGMSSDNVRMALVRAKRKARQAMEDWKHSTNQAK